jgi:hypothetical protein
MKKSIYILFSLQLITIISYAQCNGSIDLCSKQYNEVAYLTTHNAFNSDEDGLLFPNQSNNIASQLNDGVRGLMIDVYSLPILGTRVAYHSIIGLGYIPLSDIFNDIKTFLDNNPNEIVTIILECYVTANDIEDEINQSGLSNYLYTHNTVWPTLQNMIDNNSRLVVFTDEDDASSSQNWYHYVWDYAVETHYSVGTINDFTCNFNRGDPLNDLFIFNHFVTDANLGYGLYNESNDVNANPFFITRAQNCQNQTNKFPNFVTVDYYELGDGLTVVDELNNLNATSTINQMSTIFKRKIVSVRDIIGRETELKNNSILFHLYDDGSSSKKIIIE